MNATFFNVKTDQGRLVKDLARIGREQGRAAFEMSDEHHSHALMYKQNVKWSYEIAESVKPCHSTSRMMIRVAGLSGAKSILPLT